MSASRVKIGILGSQGKMGKWVCHLLETEYAPYAILESSAGRGDLLEPLLKSDVIIDFSSPQACVELTELALTETRTLPAFVIGSTGWTSSGRAVLERLATKTPVLMSANFSTGVLILLDVLEKSAPLLKRFGYTPVIVEAHHDQKKDSPSGTAIALQSKIDRVEPESVQTHSIRAGQVIGDHEVSFYGPADRIVFGHSAQDRSVFARGAIDVAIWMAKRRKDLSSHKILGIDTYFKEMKEAPSHV